MAIHRSLPAAAVLALSAPQLGTTTLAESAAAAPLSAFVVRAAPVASPRRYSATLNLDEFGDRPNYSPGVQLPDVVAGATEDDDDDLAAEAAVDALAARRRERNAARRRRSPNYRITLPIRPGAGAAVAPMPMPGTVGAADAGEESMAARVERGQRVAVASAAGLSLRQVYAGRKLSELALDVGTLRFQSFADELQGYRVDGGPEDTDGGPSLGRIQVLQEAALAALDEGFDGVVASSVVVDGRAWTNGVRAGDVLVATSATLGAQLWPKSTLDGVRSAVSSRRLTSDTMDFELRRLAGEGEDGGGEDAAAVEAVEAFELSLSRPIGINAEDTDDGYVTIVGISDKAALVVRDNLRVGDRVVSVESSVGAQMWEVSTTDGLTSAVTARLPGQPVRIVFERVVDREEVATAAEGGANASSPSGGAVPGFRQAGAPSAAAGSAVAASAPPTGFGAPSPAHEMLLSRSRDLLRTYIARREVTKNIKVADRVVEAVADAAAPLDGRTLNLLMQAYSSCDNADKAIATFEEAFRLAGDGSGREAPPERYGGRLRADMAALNRYTVAALLRAHAVRADHGAARRVLAAAEGRDGAEVEGERSRSWWGTGDPLNLRPDATCYNIALAAAVKRRTEEGMSAATEIFDSLPDPSPDGPPPAAGARPAKDLVTYNTMIDGFARDGKYRTAYGVFQQLKAAGLRPDKVTYTTLIKASIRGGDLEQALDLLDDMKWIGIQPDILSYNNLIEALCNAHRLFEAKDLVNEMELTRVAPDSMTYGLLMTGLLRAHKPGPCLTLFESACADPRTTALTENVRLYTTAVAAAAALGDHERALDLVARMNRAGIRPNEKTLTALMGACLASKKYDAAIDIFAKIKRPDSYTISVGLRALCAGGQFDEALELVTEQRSGQAALSGKQVMVGYNTLIKEALLAGEYNIAREALTGLLGAGYIPSKLTFHAMTDGLSLPSDTSFNSAAMRKLASSTPSDEKFQFLLFVLDSLERRKLAVDPAFYSSILAVGAQGGGLQKRVASLFARSRNHGHGKGATTRSAADSTDDDTPPPHRIASWEDLFENYSAYKEEHSANVVFPAVRVTTSKKNYGRVLAAEQAVAYRGRQRGNGR